jgi:hypothetical protein
MPAALLAIVLLSPLPLRAHNGAVAIAVPVEGIVADGDLSDWPEALRTYEVNHVEVGAEPQDEGDLSAWFRVAVDPSTEAIYLALEVTDDDPIVDSAEGADNWDAADGCEVYLLSDHERGRRPRQWVLWGNHRAYWAGATVENGRVGVGGTEGVRVYES